jgi:hypothetical protein
MALPLLLSHCKTGRKPGDKNGRFWQIAENRSERIDRGAAA